MLPHGVMGCNRQKAPGERRHRKNHRLVLYLRSVELCEYGLVRRIKSSVKDQGSAPELLHLLRLDSRIFKRVENRLYFRADTIQCGEVRMAVMSCFVHGLPCQ